ncbi:MAG: 50S ribosomal protein L10 [Pirellulales bacterium]
MSKFVKNLIIEDLRKRLDNVSDAVLVTVEGVEANANNRLRTELQNKNMNLLVVKNSLAARATEGTALSEAFGAVSGPAAIVWGGDDIVSLAKEISRIAKDTQFKPFETRGGVMDGEVLTPEDVAKVSKWPSREEQLSIVAGQILSVGSTLCGQLGSVGGALASQIQQKAEGEETSE